MSSSGSGAPQPPNQLGGSQQGRQSNAPQPEGEVESGPSGQPSSETAQQVVLSNRSVKQVTIMGQVFSHPQGALAYIRTIENRVQRYHAIKEFSSFLRNAREAFEEWAEAIWTEVEELKGNEDEFKRPEFRAQWRDIRDTAVRVRAKRNKVAEAITMLVDKHHWCTREFHDRVLTPFLSEDSAGMTSSMYEALKSANRANISPIETLQRACERMMDRLEGKADEFKRSGAPIWNEGGARPTPADVNMGLKIKAPERVSEGRVNARMDPRLVYDDRYSLVWEKRIPRESRGPLTDQWKMETSSKVEEIPSSPGRSRLSTPSTPTDPKEEPASETGKRKSSVDYSGMQANVQSKKRAKQGPGQYSATLDETKLADLSEILQGLAVVGEEKQAAREDSGAADVLVKMPIPIEKPTGTESALWDLMQSKVRGIAYKQPVSVAENVQKAIGLTTLEEILEALNKLASGLSQSKLNNTTAAAYIQSAVDTGSLFLRGSTEQSNTMDDIRRVARDWRNQFGHGLVTVTQGSPAAGRVLLNLDDLEHLLYEAGRSGWLNGEVIEAALRMEAGLLSEQRIYVLPAGSWSWWAQRFDPNRLPVLPSGHGHIYVPVHMGNVHWGLAHFDTTNRLMFWLDSREGYYVPRQLAFSMMRRFIDAQPSLRSLGEWDETDVRSIQQTDQINCGIFAIENGFALMHNDYAHDINPWTTRRTLAHAFYDTAATANAPAVGQRPARQQTVGLDFRENPGPSRDDSIVIGSDTSSPGAVRRMEGLSNEDTAWERVMARMARNEPQAVGPNRPTRSNSAPAIALPRAETPVTPATPSNQPRSRLSGVYNPAADRSPRGSPTNGRGGAQSPGQSGHGRSGRGPVRGRGS